jgi:hypothetical protein
VTGPLARWSRLASRDRWLLLAMMAWLPALRLLLACAGFVRSYAWIERRSPVAGARVATGAELARAQEIAALADIAGRRGPVHANCLPQALLVHALLRRRGLSPQLRIGVRKEAGVFDAHAWVELGGQPLAQATLRHVMLPREDWARALSGTR